MARLIVEIDEKLYKEFEKRTKQYNISVSEAIRQSVISWLTENEPLALLDALNKRLNS